MVGESESDDDGTLLDRSQCRRPTNLLGQFNCRRKSAVQCYFAGEHSLAATPLLYVNSVPLFYFGRQRESIRESIKNLYNSHIFDCTQQSIYLKVFAECKRNIKQNSQCNPSEFFLDIFIFFVRFFQFQTHFLYPSTFISMAAAAAAGPGCVKRIKHA